jgi:hypothetical protein
MDSISIESFSKLSEKKKLKVLQSMLAILNPSERKAFQQNIVVNLDADSDVKPCNGCARVIVKSDDDEESGICHDCGNTMCKFCGGVVFFGERSIIIQKTTRFTAKEFHGFFGGINSDSSPAQRKKETTMHFTPNEDGKFLCKKCRENHQAPSKL